MAPSLPTRVDVLYDGTSGPDQALDTGIVPASAYETLLFEVLPSATPLAGVLTLHDPGLSSTAPVRSLTMGTGVGVKTAAWGQGVQDSPGGPDEYLGGVSGPVPLAVQAKLPALGSAVTSRLRIFGRRHSG